MDLRKYAKWILIPVQFSRICYKLKNLLERKYSETNHLALMMGTEMFTETMIFNELTRLLARGDFINRLVKVVKEMKAFFLRII
jgi:hypothetical protein